MSYHRTGAIGGRYETASSALGHLLLLQNIQQGTAQLLHHHSRTVNRLFSRNISSLINDTTLSEIDPEYVAQAV